MDEELRAELLRRMEKDQEARLSDDLESGAFEAVDAENLPWLKNLIHSRGWPGASLVGTDGAHAAWLLVQHADTDPKFQQHCLILLRAAVSAGEASLVDQAFLTDRVLLHEGRPQEYGTQMTRRGGKWVPNNPSDPAHLDERRAAVGLEPIADCLARFTGPSVAAKINCPQCDTWVPFEPPEIGEWLTITCTGCGREMRIIVSQS